MRQQGDIGRVDERLPNGLYRVTMESGKEVLAYVAGKMRQRNIFPIIGDRVEVVLDPAGGKATNRIVWRK